MPNSEKISDERLAELARVVNIATVDEPPQLARELQQARAEIIELRRYAPRWKEISDCATHWETCYLEHRQCALHKIDALRTASEGMEKALEQAQK